MTTTDWRTKFQRRTSQELALEVLRHRILSGELTGGMHLVQRNIAVELGVSSTPVREALRELAAEGLVDFDAQHGATVAMISPESAREVLWLRSILEPEAMRLAARNADASDLAATRGLLEAMIRQKDAVEWSTMNRQFHASLCDASRSSWLISILQTLRNASTIYVYASLRAAPEPMSVGNSQHAELLSAIERRDESAAARVAAAHIGAIRDALDLEARGSSGA